MPLPLGIAETWAYRRFVIGSVFQEFRTRYAQSLLGSVWALLEPLTLIVIYSVIFSQLMRPGLSGYDQPYAYTVFLCSGLLMWMFFVELLTRSVGLFVENGDLLKKVQFPRLTLPIIALLAALLNYAIIMLWFVMLLVWADFSPGLVVMGALPIIFIAAGFAVGLGLFGATINVYYRDAAHLTGVLTQFWFWLTPIIYPLEIVSEGYRSFFEWNPVLPLVVAMQGIFLRGEWPQWHTLLFPTLVAFSALCLGALVYFKLGGDITDEL